MSVYKREYKSAETRKATWRFVFKHHKTSYTKSGFLRQEDALNAERELRRKVVRNEVGIISNHKVTVAQFMPGFLDNRRLTKAIGTVDREVCRARPVVAFLGGKRLTDVYPADIDEYVAKRLEKDKLSNRSVNLELTLLRSFFNYAKKKRYVVFNPAEEVKALREVQDEKWIPTKEEFTRFVEAARTCRFGGYIEPWIWFRAFTGTRPTESVYMEWGDIDFNAGLIHIRPKTGHQLKNRKFRVVDMHPELRPHLERWRRVWERLYRRRKKRYPASKDHNWVFMHPHNHDERANGFHRTFYQAREKANLPRMTSHTLRHYFISQCVMAGIPFFTIAKWVGHKNTKMIEEVYGHLSPDYCAEQMRKLSITPSGNQENAPVVPGQSGESPVGADSCKVLQFCAAGVPEVAGKVAGAKSSKMKGVINA